MARLRFPPVPVVIDDPDGLFGAGPWIAGGSFVESNEWDYNVDLHFIRRFRFNTELLAEKLMLSSDSEVRLVSSWSSNLTNYLRGRGFVHTFGLNDGEIELESQLNIPGEGTGGRLSLNSALVISRSPSAAFTPGTILWADAQTIELEPASTRMPITVLKFSEHARFAENGAKWAVHFMQDAYELPVSVAIQVYINADHKRFTEVLTGSLEEDEPIRNLLTRMIRYEIGLHIFRRALRDEVFLEAEGFEPGSFGASLRAQLIALFSNRDIQQIADHCQTSPDEFEARLQARLLRDLV